MKVLISAYACEPGKGSEPEVGLQCVLTAAQEHEVWVITRSNNEDALRRFLHEHRLGGRITVIGLEVGGQALAMKKRAGLVTLHLYHELWQRRLAALARSIDDEVDFDLVHHATFATYWSRAGVAEVDKPMVWGPVGGGVTPPLRLLPSMGLRGALADVTRVATRPLVAVATGSRRSSARADVVIAQNPETAAVIGAGKSTIVLPNGLLAPRSIPTLPEATARPTTFVSAGRLIGWKGMALAVMAMAHLDGRTLEVFGDGPDRARLEDLAAEIGVGRRVHFRGRVAREELLAAIASAGAFLHPSLHDDSPLTVAEALSLGTPVVCLDRGGPPVLAGHWDGVPSRAVAPTTPADTARRLAHALIAVGGRRVPADPTPSEAFTRGLLKAYEHAIGDGRGQDRGPVVPD